MRQNFNFGPGLGEEETNRIRLRLVQQTEDNDGESEIYNGDALAHNPGQFSIPTADIFHSPPAAAQVPLDLVIPLEQLRLINRDASGWL